MVTCYFCGNEEVEKPKIIKRFITTETFLVKDMVVLNIPFGSYCYRHNKNGCITKANTLRNIEIKTRGLERYNENI